MQVKYVNPVTGTDDTAVGRGDTALDPYASMEYTLNSVRGDITIHMAAVAYTAEDLIIRPDNGLFKKLF